MSDEQPTIEEHGFKAEVQQLLDLMIHSVYSNRDVFLRELVSNAADALDKVRFVELTEELHPARDGEAGIRIAFDEEAKTITLEDDGIGLTRDEAIKNLGTIAHSGTRAFLDNMAKADEDTRPGLIGQFGVGFYSAFMVADRVVVDSLSAVKGSEPVRWTSSGAGKYTLGRGGRDTRGTTITLHLRDDAAEYAEAHKIRSIIKQHSDFLGWPILLNEEKVNRGKAIWTEQPQNVDADEANAFYKSLSFDFEDPELRVHFKVDTPLQYAAMLFVPRGRPYDLFMPDADKGPRLYARRVLISEAAKDLLPDWLRFVRGVVDSEDIQLNVSREMVQKTPVVRKIREALVKRILKELGKLAKKPAPEAPAEEAEVIGEDGEPVVTPPVDTTKPYDRFWNNFGILLKEGYYHDKSSYGDRLMPLLRFHTSSNPEGWVSLEDYKAAMPEGQDAIWYITAESSEAALISPHLEAFRKKGWDVLLLTDTVDEWFVQQLTEVDGLTVKSVARGELELEESDTSDDAEPKADISGLGPWMTSLFGGTLASVRSSTRLTDSPCVLVDEEHGVSANMERILRQANQDVAAAKRHLELNVKHPLIKDMAALHADGKTDVVEPLARLLLDDAMLLEGHVKDAAGIGRRLQALLQTAASQARQQA